MENEFIVLWARAGRHSLTCYGKIVANVKRTLKWGK
jgi:hypothetical protein